MVKKCSIVKCVSGLPKDRNIRKSLNIKQASLFRIPKDATHLAKWSSILKMDLCENHYICDFHFNDEDIVKSVTTHFPDGTSQTIPLGRWTLLPNTVPINSKPRRYYDYEFSEYQDNQNHNDAPINQRKPSSSSENSSELLTKAEENEIGDSKHQDILKDESIDKEQLGSSHSSLNNSDPNEETGQTSSNVIVYSDKTSMTFKDIQNFVNVPPAWYYICDDKEVTFVHIDHFKFTEKIRVFINKDMSVMVSYHQQKKIDLNLTITCPADLSKLLEELRRKPICYGTGIKDMSVSARCCGFIRNNERYIRQRQSPRCTACRILRHRLISNATKKRFAIKKNCSPREPLQHFKIKCKPSQEKVIYLRIFQS